MTEPKVTSIWRETLEDGRNVTAVEIEAGDYHARASKIDGEARWWLFAMYGLNGLPIFERGIGDRSLSMMEIPDDREIVKTVEAMVSRRGAEK